MKLISIFILLLTITACSEPATRTIVIKEHVCNPNNVEEHAKFILQCIANANPRSDEEPEDWLYICEEMAKKMYCPKQDVYIDQYKNRNSAIWLDSPSIIKE